MYVVSKVRYAFNFNLVPDKVRSSWNTSIKNFIFGKYLPWRLIDDQGKAHTSVGAVGVPDVSRINKSMVGHWIVHIGGSADEK